MPRARSNGGGGYAFGGSDRARQVRATNCLVEPAAKANREDITSLYDVVPTSAHRRRRTRGAGFQHRRRPPS